MVKMATCDVNILKSALGIQQTGPRTVIVPADPIIWDAGTSYEYLTIVASTDFGQAYISKRDVPAGTPLTNTEYWIPAATFNAQLAEIMRQLTNKADTATVTALQTSLNNEVARAKAAEQANATAASSANDNANGRAPKVHRDASGATYGQATGSLFGHVKLSDSTGESDASDGVAATPKGVGAAIENQLSDLLTHIVVIGDSFSDENSRDYAWPAVLRDRYEVHNYAKSGAGYLDVTSTTQTFPIQLQNAIDDNTYDHNHVRAVIVYGGINDLLHGQTGANCNRVATNMVKTATKEFPNAKIIIAALNAPDANRESRWTKEAVTTWEDNFMRGGSGTYSWNLPFVYTSGILASFTNTTVFDDDGIHPTRTGMNVIAGFFERVINGCAPTQRVLNNPASGSQAPDVDVTDDYCFNYKFTGIINCGTVVVGDNTYNPGLAPGLGRRFYDYTNYPIPFAASNPIVANVFFSASSGLLHVICSGTGDNVNIYL